MNIVTLDVIRPGESCVIVSIDLTGAVCGRVFDMGFQPGTKVRCAFNAPSGTPMAFWVKDALIALRKNDCEKVQVVCCE